MTSVLDVAGNPHIGVLHHEEKFYVFSSKEAALKFAAGPGAFVAEVAEKAKQFPELIRLLELHQQFSRVSPYSEVSSLFPVECCSVYFFLLCGRPLLRTDLSVWMVADSAGRDFAGEARHQV